MWTIWPCASVANQMMTWKYQPSGNWVICFQPFNYENNETFYQLKYLYIFFFDNCSLNTLQELYTGAEIEEVPVTKFLGAHLDRGLTSSSHISVIKLTWKSALRSNTSGLIRPNLSSHIIWGDALGQLGRL